MCKLVCAVTISRHTDGISMEHLSRRDQPSDNEWSVMHRDQPTDYRGQVETFVPKVITLQTSSVHRDQLTDHRNLVRTFVLKGSAFKQQTVVFNKRQSLSEERNESRRRISNKMATVWPLPLFIVATQLPLTDLPVVTLSLDQFSLTMYLFKQVVNYNIELIH